jgi:hypothetical protein
VNELTRAVIGFGSLALLVSVGMWLLIWFVERDWRVPTLVVSISVGVTAVLTGLSFLISFWVVNG